MNTVRRWGWALGAVTAVVAGVLRAQTAPPVPDYHPSMGDLMTMAVQPRHIKLALAGREKNWKYAEYELSELRNAFTRIGRTIPVYRTADVPALIGALTLPGTVAAGEPPLGCGKEVCNVAVTVRLTNLPCDGKKDITVDPETLWVGTTAPKTIHWRIGNPPKDDVAFADGDVLQRIVEQFLFRRR